MTTEDPPRPCPICGAPSVPRFRPFCSVRCADADLGNWLTGRYAIPVAADEAEDEDAIPSRLPGQDGTG